MEKTSSHEEQQVVLPERTLLVLCGPAGAGKSTFARNFVAQHQQRGYRETSIVSSDHCRALICDDETNQQVNKDTFDLFHYIIHKRMLQGRLTIADSTALHADSRQKLLDLAAKHQYCSCLMLFDMSLETCLSYDQHQARGRIVGREVITYHLDLFQRALQDVPHEGWQIIYTVDEHHPWPKMLMAN
jgi:predicted kinase